MFYIEHSLIFQKQGNQGRLQKHSRGLQRRSKLVRPEKQHQQQRKTARGKARPTEGGVRIISINKYCPQVDFWEPQIWTVICRRFTRRESKRERSECSGIWDLRIGIESSSTHKQSDIDGVVDWIEWFSEPDKWDCQDGNNIANLE